MIPEVPFIFLDHDVERAAILSVDEPRRGDEVRPSSVCHSLYEVVRCGIEYTIGVEYRHRVYEKSI